MESHNTVQKIVLLLHNSPEENEQFCGAALCRRSILSAEKDLLLMGGPILVFLQHYILRCPSTIELQDKETIFIMACEQAYHFSLVIFFNNSIFVHEMPFLTARVYMIFQLNIAVRSLTCFIV